MDMPAVRVSLGNFGDGEYLAGDLGVFMSRHALCELPRKEIIHWGQLCGYRFGNYGIAFHALAERPFFPAALDFERFRIAGGMSLIGIIDSCFCDFRRMRQTMPDGVRKFIQTGRPSAIEFHEDGSIAIFWNNHVFAVMTE